MAEQSYYYYFTNSK